MPPTSGAALLSCDEELVVLVALVALVALIGGVGADETGEEAVDGEEGALPEEDAFADADEDVTSVTSGGSSCRAVSKEND